MQKLNLDVLSHASEIEFFREMVRFYFSVLASLLELGHLINEDRELIHKTFAALNIGLAGSIPPESLEMFILQFRSNEIYIDHHVASTARKFHVWVTNVYSNLGSLGVTLTPEVHATMATTIATLPEPIEGGCRGA